MSYTDDEWGSYGSSQNEDTDGIEALRREVAELKELLSGTNMDAAEEIAVQDNRRFLRERAEKDARAEKAANDPSTLEKLRQIDSEEELERFFREHGGQ